MAEKLHAIVYLGMANSRMKDFFDLWFLCREFASDGQRLVQAVRATFERRATREKPSPCPVSAPRRDAPSPGHPQGP